MGHILSIPLSKFDENETYYFLWFYVKEFFKDYEMFCENFYFRTTFHYVYAMNDM